MSNMLAFNSVKRFSDWYRHGGEYKAGLPHGSVAKLQNLVVEFRNGLTQNLIDLELLKRDWDKVVNSNNNKVVTVHYKKFVLKLMNIHSEVADLLKKGSIVRVEVNSLRPLLKAHIQQVNNKKNVSELEVLALQGALSEARKKLRQAKAELSGEKGFLNGFLTGITFTAYNPLKDNMEKANRAVVNINSSINKSNQELQNIRLSQTELAETNYLVNSLDNVNVALAEYQNIILKVQISLQESHDDAEKISADKSERLNKYYFKQTGKEITELLSWIPLFKTVK
jgi:hypothetical protein